LHANAPQVLNLSGDDIALASVTRLPVIEEQLKICQPMILADFSLKKTEKNLSYFFVLVEFMQIANSIWGSG
jgi:hypothetical protein